MRLAQAQLSVSRRMTIPDLLLSAWHNANLHAQQPPQFRMFEDDRRSLRAAATCVRPVRVTVMASASPMPHGAGRPRARRVQGDRVPHPDRPLQAH